MTNLDDTELDAIAAQVRAYPPLDETKVAELLGVVRARGDASARERLVEHHLRIALDEAIARADKGVEVVDLYQEGTVATLVAINEYASRDAAPSGLQQYVSRVVGVHLDSEVERVAAERAGAAAFVADAQQYEIAEVRLRHELGRSATVTELAALLLWDEHRVQLMGEMLNSARENWDSEIVQYLDDEEA